MAAGHGLLVVLLWAFCCLAEVEDRQQGEDEGLDQAHEEVEGLPDRIGGPQDVGGQQGDQANHDDAGEHIAEQTQGQ